MLEAPTDRYEAATLFQDTLVDKLRCARRLAAPELEREVDEVTDALEQMATVLKDTISMCSWTDGRWRLWNLCNRLVELVETMSPQLQPSFPNWVPTNGVMNGLTALLMSLGVWYSSLLDLRGLLENACEDLEPWDRVTSELEAEILHCTKIFYTAFRASRVRGITVHRLGPTPAGSPSAPRLVAIPLPDNTNTSRSTSPGLGASETSAPLWPTGALSDLWSSNSRPSSPFSPDAFLILEDSPPTPPPSEGGNSPVSPGYEPLSPSRSWRRRLVDVPTDTFFTDNEGVEMNGFDLGDDSKHLYCRFPIKFTAYRILNTFLVSVFGMAKAILSYQGRRDAPTTLEWVLGVLVFVSMYWLGLCETAKPPVAPWFFHRDYATSTLCCLRRKRRRSKQVEGYQV